MSSTTRSQEDFAVRRPEVWQRLACPSCRLPLDDAESGLRCAACGQRYAAAAGGAVPILLAPTSELYEAEFADWRPSRQRGTPAKSYRQARGLPPTNVTRISEPAKRAFLAAVGSGAILNVGSGQCEIHGEANWVNLDIHPHHNVDVVGDAHQLPFLDDSFDAVYSVSVLEHLRDPFLAAREMARVLKPGGRLWCTAPFAYPVHGHPHDYFRFTPAGYRSVFQDLEIDTIGPATGPVTTIGHFAERALDALLPGKLGFLARWTAAWCIQPWKYLDPLLVRRDATCASSYFVVARKA